MKIIGLIVAAFLIGMIVEIVWIFLSELMRRGDGADIDRQARELERELLQRHLRGQPCASKKRRS